MVALALGIFTLVVIEQLPIGVLTLISDDLEVTYGNVGLAVTLPGLIAGIIALLVPGLTKRLNRKTVLVMALLATFVSCSISALAPNYLILMASRIVTGIAIGFYWPVVPLLASAQVEPKDRAKALTIAYAGTGSALVLGLPLATWLGTWLSWRGAFFATALLSFIVLVLVLISVKPMRPVVVESVRSTLLTIQLKGVRRAVSLTLILITAQFIAYSYISPILNLQAGIKADEISQYLLIFGISGFIGNFVAGSLVKQHPRLAITVLTLGSIAALGLVLILPPGAGYAAIWSIAWGFFAGMGSVSLQSLIMFEAGPKAEAATALNSAAYNLAIGAGAVIGGFLVDSFNLTWVIATALFGFMCALTLLIGSKKNT